jgi:hypothetical protein
MGVTVERLSDKSQTASRIKELVSKFSGDLKKISLKKGSRLVPLASLPLSEYFDFVKNLPYRRDKKPVEVVARPALLLTSDTFAGNDCKKKSILMASYLKENGIPYRFVGSSNRKDGSIHHIFVQGLFRVNDSKEWLNLDATYANYRPFGRKMVTKAVIL